MKTTKVLYLVIAFIFSLSLTACHKQMNENNENNIEPDYYLYYNDVWYTQTDLYGNKFSNNWIIDLKTEKKIEKAQIIDRNTNEVYRTVKIYTFVGDDDNIFVKTKESSFSLLHEDTIYARSDFLFPDYKSSDYSPEELILQKQYGEEATYRIKDKDDVRNIYLLTASSSILTEKRFDYLSQCLERFDLGVRIDNLPAYVFIGEIAKFSDDKWGYHSYESNNTDVVGRVEMTMFPDSLCGWEERNGL